MSIPASFPVQTTRSRGAEALTGRKGNASTVCRRHREPEMTTRTLATATFAAAAVTIGLTIGGLALAQVATPAAPPQTYANLMTPLFTGHETVIGQPIAFLTDPNPVITSS